MGIHDRAKAYKLKIVTGGNLARPVGWDSSLSIASFWEITVLVRRAALT